MGKEYEESQIKKENQIRAPLPQPTLLLHICAQRVGRRRAQRNHQPRFKAQFPSSPAKRRPLINSPGRAVARRASCAPCVLTERGPCPVLHPHHPTSPSPWLPGAAARKAGVPLHTGALPARCRDSRFSPLGEQPHAPQSHNPSKAGAQGSARPGYLLYRALFLPIYLPSKCPGDNLFADKFR